MEGSIKVSYNLKENHSVMKEVDDLDNAIVSRDATVVRFFNKSNTGHVFSPVVFLNKEAYDKWNDEFEREFKKKSATVSVIRDRFLKGLDILDEYFKNSDLTIEQKSEIAKIRNHVASADPSTNPNLVADDEISYMNEKKLTLKGILGSDVSDEQFYALTTGFFEEEVADDKRKGYHYRQFDALDELDKQIAELDGYFKQPESELTESRLFSGNDAVKRFYKDIEEYNAKFDALVAQKIQIISDLMDADEFAQEHEEIHAYKLNKTSTEEIRNVINDKYRICSSCGKVTDSHFCSNIKCVTTVYPQTVYRLSDEVVMDYSILDAKKINIPVYSLNPTSDIDKKAAITNSGKRFREEVKTFLDENAVSMKINFMNTNQLKTTENFDDELSKTAIFNDDDEEIQGQTLHFWDYYEYKGKIYGIVQLGNEIKTPELVQEVRDNRKRMGSTRPIKESGNFYDNNVIFVIADKFGQIEEVDFGILYTGDPKNIKLKLGLTTTSRMISIKQPKYRPNISDIMYVRDEISFTTDNNDEFGERLFNDLNTEDTTSDRYLRSPVYRYSRRHYYPLSLGNIYYVKNGELLKRSKDALESLGLGTINKFGYITIADSIRYSQYSGFKKDSWAMKLVKTYLTNPLSPNAGAKKFFENYEKQASERYITAYNKASQPASLFETVLPNSKMLPRWQERDNIIASTSKQASDFSNRELAVYNIKSVTPFFIQELHASELVEHIEIAIMNNQADVRNGKLNTLSKETPSYPSKISQYLPKTIKEGVNPLQYKHLIQNGLKTMSDVDDFTISLNITLRQNLPLYEKTLIQKYMQENGIYTMERKEEIMTIPVKTNDLMAMLL